MEPVKKIPEYITIKEAKAISTYSTASIWRRIKEGKLKATQVMGSKWIIDKEHFLKFIRDGFLRCEVNRHNKQILL